MLRAAERTCGPDRNSCGCGSWMRADAIGGQLKHGAAEETESAPHTTPIPFAQPVHPPKPVRNIKIPTACILQIPANGQFYLMGISGTSMKATEEADDAARILSSACRRGKFLTPPSFEAAEWIGEIAAVPLP